MGTVYAIKNRFALGGVRLFNGRSTICRAVPFHGIEERRRTNQSECRRDQKEARVMWRLAVPEMLGEKPCNALWQRPQFCSKPHGDDRGSQCERRPMRHNNLSLRR